MSFSSLIHAPFRPPPPLYITLFPLPASPLAIRVGITNIQPDQMNRLLDPCHVDGTVSRYSSPLDHIPQLFKKLTPTFHFQFFFGFDSTFFCSRMEVVVLLVMYVWVCDLTPIYTIWVDDNL